MSALFCLMGELAGKKKSHLKLVNSPIFPTAKVLPPAGSRAVIHFWNEAGVRDWLNDYNVVPFTQVHKSI